MIASDIDVTMLCPKKMFEKIKKVSDQDGKFSEKLF
jgi:hypothetical protein